MRYHAKGVCAQEISFELEDGAVRSVRFNGGCHGNHQGISALVEGMPAGEVVSRLSGIRCGFRDTSCPDQLAKAIAAAMKEG